MSWSAQSPAQAPRARRADLDLRVATSTERSAHRPLVRRRRSSRRRTVDSVEYLRRWVSAVLVSILILPTALGVGGVAPAALASTQVQGARASLASYAAGATGVIYSVYFSTQAPITSSDPGGAAIYLTLPIGTVPPDPAVQPGAYGVSANGQAVPLSNASAQAGLVTLALNGSGTVVPAGASVVVTIADMASPPVPDPYQIEVRTSGDVATAGTDPYTLIGPSLPAALADSSVGAAPQTVNTGSQAVLPTIRVAVHLAGSQLQPVAGKTVTLSAYGGGAYSWSTTPPTAQTDATGTASFTVSTVGVGYTGPLLLGAYDDTDSQFIGGDAVYFYQLSLSGGEYVGATESLGGRGLPPDAQVTGASFGGATLALTGSCTTDLQGMLGSCAFVVPSATVGQAYPLDLLIDGLTFTQNMVVAGAPSGTPVASTVSIGQGNGQSTSIGTPFPLPLAVLVEDGQGSPFLGAAVTFRVTPGANGAGATFAGGATTATVQSQASGLATAPQLVANQVAGAFSVIGAVAGVGSVTFNLQTDAAPAPPPPPPSPPPPPPASIQYLAGNGQAAVLGQAFAQPLAVRVLDASGQPVFGVPVTLSAPSSGATMSFAQAQTSITVRTDRGGVASAGGTAEGGVGAFRVTASVPGVPGQVAFVVKDANVIVQTCDDASLQAAFAVGGYVAFDCSATIALSRTLSVQSGADLTLDASGNQVTLQAPGAGPDCFAFAPSGPSGVDERVFDVQGGQLTLIDLTVACGQVDGAAGSAGAKGTSSAAHPTPGGAGRAGLPALGGAMYIAPGATVTLVQSLFTDNVVYGGAGGEGGSGGKGLFQVGSPGMAGAAGGDGGAGGTAQGGAIYNLGNLTIDQTQFVDNAAFGGPGGNSGAGGAGANGAQGAPGTNGPPGAPANCRVPGSGQSGTVGISGRSGGAGAPAGLAGSGGSAQGAAVYSQGAVRVNAAVFRANMASGGVGGSGLAGGAGGIGGLGGPGGRGGHGGNFILWKCKKNLTPGAGGAGGAGGQSGDAGYGGLGGGGGGGGSAQGGALWDGGALDAQGVSYAANAAIGGGGGRGGAGGGAPAGVSATGGAGGAGGVQCLSWHDCAPLFGSPTGATGKSGGNGPKALGGQGGLGGDGGGGGNAQGGALYVGRVAVAPSQGAATLGGNAVMAGHGGPPGPGGCTNGPVFFQSGKPSFGCAASYGRGIIQAKTAAAGSAGPAGTAAGPDSYAQTAPAGALALSRRRRSAG